MTTASQPTQNRGDADVAAVAELFADPARARIIAALADGRALPASVLAAEAGIAPSSASSHLSRLTRGGLLTVETSGRHRYYRMSGERVASVYEVLASLAPAQPVRSLRQGTRAEALRRARTCYDHLAGRLGVDLTLALVEHRALERTDGRPGVDRSDGDRLSAPLGSAPYRIGPAAVPVLTGLGVDPGVLDGSGGGRRRPLLRFCVDWSEQRHHLAGALGTAVLTSLVDQGWIERRPRRREVTVTARGAAGLRDRLSLTS